MADLTRGGATGRPGSPSIARAMVLPGVLAVTAGFVDAVGFLHLFGAFPANQSGNLVLLGMALASPIPPPAWVSATSIFGFVLGTAGAAWIASRLQPAIRRRVLLAIELVLLVGLAVANAAVAPDRSPLTGATLGALLLVAAVAMGVQTEAIRRAAGVAIATTYETGAVARIGEALAAPEPGDRRPFRAGTAVVLAAMVACYVGGAAVGAGPLGEGRAGLVVPCLAVGAVLVAAWAGGEPDS